MVPWSAPTSATSNRRFQQSNSAADLGNHDITQPVYRAVFTAHPVFALRHDVSMALCGDAEADKAQMPDQPYDQRREVTLNDEHAEAMEAICNARRAICELNAAILQQRQEHQPDDWRTSLPQMLGFRLGLAMTLMVDPISVGRTVSDCG